MDRGPSTGAASVAAWEDAMRAIVGREHLRSVAGTDAVGEITARIVVEPGNEQELSKVLKCADKAGLAVIPRGGGTKLEWGNPPRRADLFLSMARLNRVIEHAWADLTVTVEAGCTMQKLQDTLAKHGQRIALDALWPERATLGGVLSTNDSGALRLRFGSLRDLIIGVTLALPDGTLASSGGKVVKNVAGYDLPKLATGALGTLGVITQAVFRVHPLPKFSRTLTIRARNPEEAQRTLLSVQDSKLAHAALQMRAAGSAAPEVDVLFEGTTSGIVGQRTQLESLVAPLSPGDAAATVWTARQDLFSASTAGKPFTVGKISVLPAFIAATFERIARVASEGALQWRAVVQATGLGGVRLEGGTQEILAALQALRVTAEAEGGSLVVLHRPKGMAAFDAWGSPGDALPLMRAVKQQLDPRGTLNPARFVGGI